MRAVELHSVRKVRATKSRVRLGKKKKKKCPASRVGQSGSGGPTISVILCSNFSFSDFAVALCKKAVFFSSVQPIISVGSF